MAKKVLPMEKEITLNGIVEEIDFGKGESGIIIDDGNGEYLVVMDRTGKRLLEHVDEEVEAHGTVTRKDGDLVFKVSRFEPLDYYCDEDYDFSELDDYWNA